MKDKNLLPDNDASTLEDLTDQANQIIESLENEKDLNNSVESYQQLLKLNNIIEKKFHKSFNSMDWEYQEIKASRVKLKYSGGTRGPGHFIPLEIKHILIR